HGLEVLTLDLIHDYSLKRLCFCLLVLFGVAFIHGGSLVVACMSASKPDRCPPALCCALGVYLPRSPRRERPARGCLYVRNAIHFMIFLFVLFVHLTPRPCARLRCF